MKKPGFSFARFKNGLKIGWQKHNQKVLAIMAGGFAIAAVVEAVKAGPKASEIKKERNEAIDEITNQLQTEQITKEEFSKKRNEINFQACKEYAITFGTTACLLALSLGSTAVGYKVSIGKQAALLGAYKALEYKSDELIEKAKEVVGEKKVTAIKDAVTKKHIDEADLPENIKRAEYEKDKDGNAVAKPYDYPCWDDISGRPFLSTVTKIDQAMTRISQKCMNWGSVSMNDIYYELGGDAIGLPNNSIGESHGFVARDLIDGLLPYETTSIMKDGYDCPLTVLRFRKEPVLLVGEDY